MNAPVADLVTQFEKRTEAMVVCMRRPICVDLYEAPNKLRPEWEAEMLKVVMTGCAEDGPEWQKLIGNMKQWRNWANELTQPSPTRRYRLQLDSRLQLRMV